MIEVTVIACIAVITLGSLVAVQAREAERERAQWRAERRFLIDRVIARHVGEVVPLEREDTRKNQTVDRDFTDQVVRPLIEGLS